MIEVIIKDFLDGRLSVPVLLEKERNLKGEFIL